MNIDLSVDEAVAIIDALDLAVRTNGMRAAAVALPIAAKLDGAIMAERNEPREGSITLPNE